MHIKKTLAIVMAACLLLVSFAGCVSQTPSPAAKTTIGLITDVGGVNDQSFNQSAWEGLKKLDADLGTDSTYIESKTETDYHANIETFVDQKRDLIWGIGFMLGDAIAEAGKNNPDNQFAIIDYAYSDDQVPNKNVTGVVFKAEQCSFLVGYIAGKMTETGKVGHINGMPSPTMESFAVGYYAGVRYANPDCVIMGQYAGDFNDVPKGKAIANQYYADGCDIIYSACGNTGNGAIEAAKEKGLWAIGVDKDQNYLAPENVLTSALKRVDVAVYDVSKKMSEGKLTGGETLVYSLENDGVGYSTTGNFIPQTIIDEVEALKKDIKDGKLTVPASYAELEAMFPGIYDMPPAE